MKVATYGVIVLLLVVYSVVMTFQYLDVIRHDPVSYPIQPFSLNADIYTTDDIMIITSYRCNYEPNPLAVQTVERYFMSLDDGKRYDMPPSPGIIQVGCSWQDARVINGFHPDMPSGRYVKRGVTEMKGRYKTVYVTWQTEPFQYVKTR